MQVRPLSGAPCNGDLGTRSRDEFGGSSKSKFQYQSTTLELHCQLDSRAHLCYCPAMKPFELDRTLLKPGAYSFWKNEKCLYVGHARVLLARIGGHISGCNRRNYYSHTNRIVLYPCKTLREAKILERKLVEKFRPLRNVYLRGTNLSNVVFPPPMF